MESINQQHSQSLINFFFGSNEEETRHGNMLVMDPFTVIDQIALTSKGTNEA